MQNEENREQLSSENFQQANWSFSLTVSFFNQNGCEVSVGGNTGQSYVGGN